MYQILKDNNLTITTYACNDNTINNTALARQRQAEASCAVALTCHEGTTTVTPSPSIAGCPSDTLYDITTRSAIYDIPANTELCLPKMLGAQTATIFYTSTTVDVVIANPDVANCPTGTVKVNVTPDQGNVRFSTVCVHLLG